MCFIGPSIALVTVHLRLGKERVKARFNKHQLGVQINNNNSVQINEHRCSCFILIMTNAIYQEQCKLGWGHSQVWNKVPWQSIGADNTFLLRSK